MSKTIRSVTLVENMACAECGMLVEPAGAFHPWLYCWLFKRGVSRPGEFLATHGFVPDPAVWGDPQQHGPTAD